MWYVFTSWLFVKKGFSRKVNTRRKPCILASSSKGKWCAAKVEIQAFSLQGFTKSERKAAACACNIAGVVGGPPPQLAAAASQAHLLLVFTAVFVEALAAHVGAIGEHLGILVCDL
jgi:hypothetical protein